jgi:hypothetical protein
MSNIIVIETSNEANIVTVEDQVSLNIEVVNSEKFLISDLPDNIPLTKIKKSGVDGLDYYLDNYFYELDCGSP